METKAVAVIQTPINDQPNQNQASVKGKKETARGKSIAKETTKRL